MFICQISSKIDPNLGVGLFNDNASATAVKRYENIKKKISENLQDIIPKKAILPGSSRLFTLKSITSMIGFLVRVSKKDKILCSLVPFGSLMPLPVLNWIYHRKFPGIPAGCERLTLEITRFNN